MFLMRTLASEGGETYPMGATARMSGTTRALPASEANEMLTSRCIQPSSPLRWSLMRFLIARNAPDPFSIHLLEAGRPLIAAQKTGRQGHGIEIDPYYVDTTIRRFKAIYGIEAVLVGEALGFE